MKILNFDVFMTLKTYVVGTLKNDVFMTLKTYVVGTLKNGLNEMVPSSSHKKKIFKKISTTVTFLYRV